MSTAIAKNLMAEMKLLGMFAAFDLGVGDALIEGGEHAQEFHLGHQILSDCGTHKSKLS